MIWSTVMFLMTTGSMQTESDASQAGQSNEIASQLLTRFAALIAVIFTCLNSALQCGHTLMGSLSLVGCGLAFASYRERAPTSASAT